MRVLIVLLVMILGTSAASASEIVDVTFATQEKQVTKDALNHSLSNANIWSPDSRWIVYDTPVDTSCFSATQISRVNVENGEVDVLFQSHGGACCGVASYKPRREEVVFILGPDHPSPDWTYAFTRRRGAIVATSKPKSFQSLDAMNYAPPFTSGALRGGSHVHMFSGDGEWVSFTYEDEVLARSTSGEAEPNQRNIGVSIPLGPVTVNRNHPRNNDGTYFSVVVSRTVATPRPGSDEISRAFEEAWVGRDGYVRADGTRQRRALAMQGLVKTKDGTEIAEVFLLDLPDDLAQPSDSPLEGTLLKRPAPPRGIIQRRLTFSDNEKYPGIQGPRHWLRSSPDGAEIAYLRKDAEGVVQIWLVSPNGGPARQLTFNPWSVASSFSWSSDGRYLAYVMDQSVFITESKTGRTYRLTKKFPPESDPLAQSCAFSPDGSAIAFLRSLPVGQKHFAHICIVTVPDRIEALK